MAECIFCKIVDKQIPSNIIYEDESHLAFLDISPFEKGHTLVVPKKHYEKITDMSSQEYEQLQSVVLKVAKHYEEVLNVRVGTLVYGLDVAHVHIHVFPITSEIEVFNFSNTKKYLGNEIENYVMRLKL